MRSSLTRLSLLALLAAPAPSRVPAMAAPEVIVFNGGPLQHRVTLSDFAENARLMQSTSQEVRTTSDSLRVRPRIRVAMYWGTQWRGRLDLPDSISAFAFDGAQSGTLYPAWRGKPARWVFGSVWGAAGGTRAISAEGIALLRKHEIPVVIH